MHRFKVICSFLFLALNSTSVSAASETPLSIKDPKLFFDQLQEMGYAPDPVDVKAPTVTVIHSNGDNYGIVLGGCTDNKNCSYIVVFEKFTNVPHPPVDFVAKMNANYDLIKVWESDEHLLEYSMGMVVEGMPRSVFRANMDIFVSSGNDLGNEVVKAKLNAPATSPAKH